MKRHTMILLAGVCLACLLSACAFRGIRSTAEDPLPVTAGEGTPEPAVLSPEISLVKAQALTPGQQALLEDFMARWYRSVGTFTVEDFAPLFAGGEEAARHAASCRTQAAIRAAAVEDLHLSACAVTLSVTGVEEGEKTCTVTADENTVMCFAGLPGVDSELLDLPHIFQLEQIADDSWRIVHHEADDNPYFSFTYDPGRDVDARYETLLENIARRRETAGSSPAEIVCDHPYDRAAALEYMTVYADHRNPDWYVYDPVGGNCMNFGSQILLAGGIPMDDTGGEKWFWHDSRRLDLSFINVDNFLDYARGNTGYGLAADADAPWDAGQVGDLLLLGIDEPRHTTAICGLVTDEQGRTVDYLLCSNTTNYRNFPAGAYYYTLWQPVRIAGWND